MLKVSLFHVIYFYQVQKNGLSDIISDKAIFIIYEIQRISGGYIYGISE